MQRTNIYLEERQTAALDLLAAEEGTSRAELIRRIIDDRLADATSDVHVDLAWIDASFGVAVDLEFPDRSPDQRSDRIDDLFGAGR